MWVHPVKVFREKNRLTLAAFGSLFAPPKTAGEVHKWERGRVPRLATRCAVANLTNGEVPITGWEDPAAAAMPLAGDEVPRRQRAVRPLTKRSAASKKAWRSRKRMAEARA